MEPVSTASLQKLHLLNTSDSNSKTIPVTTNRKNLSHPLVPKLNFSKMMSLKAANNSNKLGDLSLGGVSVGAEPHTLDLAQSSSFSMFKRSPAGHQSDRNANYY